jgi:hypothetical protein
VEVEMDLLEIVLAVLGLKILEEEQVVRIQYRIQLQVILAVQA